MKRQVSFPTGVENMLTSHTARDDRGLLVASGKLWVATGSGEGLSSVTILKFF